MKYRCCCSHDDNDDDNDSVKWMSSRKYKACESVHYMYDEKYTEV